MCRGLIQLISVLLLTLCLMSPAHAANVLVVNEAHDYDGDGKQDDYQLVDWLEAEGHLVTIQPDHWMTLDTDKMKALNAADLIIVSRTCNSTMYDEGDEPTQWNSATTPLILMQALIVRSNRWKWINSSSANSLGGAPALEVVQPDHPIFANVTLGPGNKVQVVDPTVGSGNTSSVNADNVGNGTLLAKEEGTDLPWIAEWEAGVEFYDGAGQIAADKRLMFFGGTQETDGPPRTPWGAWNFTAEGEIMFRNAINYMLGPSWKRATARNPVPDDYAVYESTWVNLGWQPGELAVSHDVYLGDNYDGVSSATPDSDVFRGNQVTTFYVAGFPGFAYPDGLVPGTTYYWRIDEVNDADPNSPWKGRVWRFSIPPKTAYKPHPADGAEFVGPDVTLTWTPGFGAKLHHVYLGDNWAHVEAGVPDTYKGPRGFADFVAGTLELEKVYYWRVDEFDGVETYQGDIWSFTTPGAVGSPQPSYDATDVEMNVTLSWTAADSAASHQFYFGTDKEAVRNAETGSPEYIGSEARGTQSYDPGLLEPDTAYYWRVDEVDGQGNTSKGPLWIFTTGAFLLVEDFEDYIDEGPGYHIWQVWIDGFGDPNNGSQVGHLLPPYAEQLIVHSGVQSMPLFYTNEAGVTNSEAAMTLTAPRDWTQAGVAELSLWFRGISDNAPEPLYVAISNTAGAPAVVAHEDLNAAQARTWKQWVIPLQAFADQGINLTNVDKIAIGLGTKAGMVAPGGTGTVYIDDIRLYRQNGTSGP